MIFESTVNYSETKLVLLNNKTRLVDSVSNVQLTVVENK